MRTQGKRHRCAGGPARAASLLITAMQAILLMVAPAVTAAADNVPSQDATMQQDLRRFTEIARTATFDQCRIFADYMVCKYPNAAPIHLAYARLLRQAGQNERAIQEYVKASQFDATNSEPVLALAELSLENLDVENALLYAREALRVKPDCQPARTLLISALIQSDRLLEAQKELNQALQSGGRNPALWHLAAQVQSRRGDFASARKYLESAVALNPGQPEWVLELCRILENSGDSKAARQYLEQVLSDKPDSIEARLRLGRNHEVYSHDYDAAINCYKKVLSRDPDNAQAITGIDRCCNKMNNIALRLKIELRSLWKSSK